MVNHVQRTPYTRWYSDLHISIWLFQFPNNSIENPSLDLLRKLPLNYGTMTFGFTYHKKGSSKRKAVVERRFEEIWETVKDEEALR